MTPQIDVNSLLVLASPFLGTTGIQHIVAALKGTIPSKFLPLAALACGVLMGWVCAAAFGYTDRQGIAMFTLIGLLAGADASAGASAIKTADRTVATVNVEADPTPPVQVDIVDQRAAKVDVTTTDTQTRTSRRHGFD